MQSSAQNSTNSKVFQNFNNFTLNNTINHMRSGGQLQNPIVYGTNNSNQKWEHHETQSIGTFAKKINFSPNKDADFILMKEDYEEKDKSQEAQTSRISTYRQQPMIINGNKSPLLSDQYRDNTQLVVFGGKKQSQLTEANYQ